MNLSRIPSPLIALLLLSVLFPSVTPNAAVAAPLTYIYDGPVLSGSAPFSGDQLTASVTFDSADLLPLGGGGGTLLAPQVQSFSYVSVGSNLTIDSGNHSFAFMSYTFDGDLDIVSWAVSIEAYLGLGSPTRPEHISTQHNGVLVGQDDTFPNSSLWSLVGPFATSSSIGSWTTPAGIPEPSTAVLFLCGILFCGMRRFR